MPGLELVEMADSRQDSLCCGGGGGRVWMDTPKGERFSDLRLEQAAQAGAGVLVTSCPYCITNFEESRLALGDDDPLEIKDITEVIQDALQKSQDHPQESQGAPQGDGDGAQEGGDGAQEGEQAP